MAPPSGVRRHKPWAPEGYCAGVRSNLRLLVVGDSHYCDGDDKDRESFTEEMVERGVAEHWSFFDHIRKTSLGIVEPFTSVQFWEKVAFVNLVQQVMPTSDSVPDGTQFEEGWLALRETVAQLRPDVMLMYSARGWNADTVASDLIEDDGAAYVRYHEISGMGYFPRRSGSPLWAAALNHPRQPGCTQSVWRIWTEKVWSLAEASQRL